MELSSRTVFLLLGHYHSFVSCFDKMILVRCWMLLLQYNRYVPDVNSEVRAMFQHQALTKSVFMSTQISFWLIENGFTVLIAACDTFRAGAVEQLRTHQRRLNSLHPPERHGGRPMVQLYEKGYGKDAAGIAMEAIAYGILNSRGRWLPRSTLSFSR